MPTSQTLAMLDGLGLPLPDSTRKIFVQDAGKPLDAAVLDVLDQEDLSSKAERVMKKGESLIDNLHHVANSETVVGVLKNLESQDLQADLVDGIRRFNPDAFLRDCDQAISDQTARHSFISNILDLFLDFFLRMLPAVRIPEVSGSYRGTSFLVYDLDMSGLHFRKEDVAVSLQNFRGASGSGIRAVTRQRESEILTVEARNVTGLQETAMQGEATVAA